MGYCLNCLNFVNKGFIWCRVSHYLIPWDHAKFENTCEDYRRKDWTLPLTAPSVFTVLQQQKQQLIVLLEAKICGRSYENSRTHDNAHGTTEREKRVTN
jgi:hypothetical protein